MEHLKRRRNCFSRQNLLTLLMTRSPAIVMSTPSASSSLTVTKYQKLESAQRAQKYCCKTSNWATLIFDLSLTRWYFQYFYGLQSGNKGTYAIDQSETQGLKVNVCPLHGISITLVAYSTL